MKAFFITLIIVGSIALGLGTGFFLHSGPEVALRPAARTDTAAEPAARNLPDNAADSSVAGRLEQGLSMASGVTRWLYWMEAIEKASLPDFPRLARLAKPESAELKMLATRWIELNPRHLFDTLLTTPDRDSIPLSALEQMLLEVWPKRDSTAVIKALSESPPFGRRQKWREHVASEIIQKDPELGIRLFSQWHIESLGPHMDGIIEWAARDPRHAAEFTIAHLAGYLTHQAIEVIGAEWGKANPAAALDFAAGSQSDLGPKLAASALKTWAEKDLSAAAEWLARAEPSARNRLSAPFVEAWAKDDPASALTWAESNLTGSTLARAAGSVLKGAAEKDVAAAARLVAVMKPSSARAAAAASVAHKWFPDRNDPIKQVSPEALKWLGQLDAHSIRKVVDEVYWRWAEQDPESFAPFLGATKVENISDHAYDTLVRSLARQSPEKAIEWATDLPEKKRMRVGGVALAEWRRAQPEAASAWLNALPADDPRRTGYFEAAVRQLVFDHNAADQFASLPSEQRAAARQIIEKISLPAETRGKLLDVLTQ